MGRCVSVSQNADHCKLSRLLLIVFYSTRTRARGGARPRGAGSAPTAGAAGAAARSRFFVYTSVSVGRTCELKIKEFRWWWGVLSV